MSLPLQVLILEDRPDDADLMVEELRRAGFDPQWQRVYTEEDFRIGLQPQLDLVLADYVMPAFDAPRALAIMKQQHLHIPFIIVTGSVGEEKAVECMKQGATDYLLKDRLTRLGPAVKQALEQNRLRTEKQQAEEALREAESFFHSTVDALLAQIAILDETGTILALNKTWRDLNTFNVLAPKHAEEGNNYLAICESLCLAGVEQATVLAEGIRAVISGRRNYFVLEFPCSATEPANWFMTRVTRFPDDHRSRVVISHVDITVTKRLEAQLRQAHKIEAIARLASGVAHDFNNLLTVIGGYSDLIALEHPDPASPLHSHTEGIKKAVEQATSLTRQLLAFSRQQALQPQVLSLNMVVTEMEKMLHRLLGDHIQMISILDPALRFVKVDRTQMEQVLMNLALNARDAMAEGGRLTIRTSNVDLDQEFVAAHPDAHPGPYVLLNVCDNGRGMDEATRAHVFEPFFTTKEPQKGTGLGLAMVHGIIRQSNGHITVASEVGQGTSFNIYLPAE